MTVLRCRPLASAGSGVADLGRRLLDGPGSGVADLGRSLLDGPGSGVADLDRRLLDGLGSGVADLDCRLLDDPTSAVVSPFAFLRVLAAILLVFSVSESRSEPCGFLDTIISSIDRLTKVHKTVEGVKAEQGCRCRNGNEKALWAYSSLWLL